MIDDVQVVSVPVSDQQRAKNFYLDKLGFELREDRLWAEGMRWVEVAPRELLDLALAGDLVRGDAPWFAPGPRRGLGRHPENPRRTRRQGRPLRFPSKGTTRREPGGISRPRR